MQYRSNRITVASAILMAAMITSAGVVHADGNSGGNTAVSTNASSDNHPIQVLKVKVPDSKLLGFKAQTIVNQPLIPLVATIMDVNGGTEWLPDVSEMRLLEEDLSNQRLELYMVLDMPFPVTDRDLVVESKFTQSADGTVKIINTSTKSSKMPPKSDKIRISKYIGNWKFEPIAPNQTRVTLEGYGDPSGGLPSWVVNLFVEKQPKQLLMNLKKQVTKPRYQRSQLNFVKEKY